MALHLVNQCDFLNTQNVVLDKGNCKGRTTTVLFVLEGTQLKKITRQPTKKKMIEAHVLQKALSRKPAINAFCSLPCPSKGLFVWLVADG
jgi:hypothetical protein